MTEASTPPVRTPSAIDAIAEEWVTTLVDLDPDYAIWIGVEGRTGEYGDLSPAGHEARTAAARAAAAKLSAEAPVDAVDEVTKTDLLAQLNLELESAELGLHLRDLNVIASPAQGIRDSFDLMPTATDDNWERIAERMSNVPGAVSGYIETLREGISRGIVPARRILDLDLRGLGGKIIGGRAPRHALCRPDGMFGRDQHVGVFLQEFLGQLEGFLAQVFLGHGIIHHANLGGFLAGEGTTGAGIKHGVALVKQIGDHLRHHAARQDAPIDFRQAENGVIGRDGEIGADAMSERAADAITVDHGNGRLAIHPQLVAAPLAVL